MKRYLKRSIILPMLVFALLLVSGLSGVALLRTTNGAHAASVAPKARMFGQAASAAPLVLPSNCYSTLIHLNGSHPATATCAIPGKRINGKMVPDTKGVGVGKNGAHPSTQPTDCGNWIYINAVINTWGGGQYCFEGLGYSGIGPISGVSGVTNF